ncbi:hypothetical protein [Mucilaginibacter sp. NFX135]|uniref:hypothetical protein n=1 Tax=Mucilaginibacter sp. NFX135 TaxID=3402687 RepID=UPI003AFAE42B
MNTAPTDSQLEYELQELYILSEHWLQDISFLEDELRFFNHILSEYREPGMSSTVVDFTTKVQEQEKHVNFLKIKIPEFLHFLKPFISDQKKGMDLGFLEKYNKLETELRLLFAAVKATKKELFRHTEAIMTTDKTLQTR